MDRWKDWKRIGEVGVDSGQLMIVDPCYVDGEWERDQEFRDIRRYRDRRNGQVYQYGKDFETFESPVTKGKTPSQLIADGIWEAIPYESSGRFGYDTVSHATIYNAVAQLNYRTGREGVAVAFRSGYGDGFYPVYAQLNNEGRVMRVAVEMGDE